jgi:hypothetical protein
MKNRSRIVFTWIVVAVGAMAVRPASAQTYVSAEPIASQDVIGASNLSKLESIGLSNLDLWSQRLLKDCHMVQNVIDVLANNQAITTVLPSNTRYLAAAGGFQAVTDPTFVLTIEDSGNTAASSTDIYVLDNALGYAFSQSGTAQFSVGVRKRNSFEFPLDYAVVTFGGYLTPQQAKGFFDYLGTIDPALWSGENAGFTQVNFSDLPILKYRLDDSMLFLIGSVSKQEFTQGLSEAVSTTPNTTYFPLDRSGTPTTAKASVAFPGNDWVAFPNGDQYLANLGSTSPQLLSDLATLRQQHLQATTDLLTAIDNGNVEAYLTRLFACPTNQNGAVRGL